MIQFKFHLGCDLFALANMDEEFADEFMEQIRFLMEHALPISVEADEYNPRGLLINSTSVYFVEYGKYVKLNAR